MENITGEYHLQCADRPQKYVGQTGRTFRTRFKEHIRNTKDIIQNSKFVQHILHTKHEYEIMEKTIKILHTEKHGQMLQVDTYERFHIQSHI
jgi:hypothetical protein